MMKKMISSGVACLLLGSVLTGCGNEDQLKNENVELKSQVEQLQQENKKLENEVAMYVPKETTIPKNSSEAANQPVSLVSLQFPEYVVPQVEVTFKNNTAKVVDGIEFVVLGFDNFGQPANDTGMNITGKITMQKSIKPGDTASSGWNVFSLSEKAKKGKIVVSKVHFTDGATWINNDYDKIVEKEKGQYEQAN